MRIAVTGANGFVGRAVIEAALARGHAPIGVVRRPGALPDGVEERVVGDLAHDGARAIAGADAVVHLAARVHVLEETEADPLAAFRAVNVGLLGAVASAAAEGGVRRFVLVSSAAVYGSRTPAGRPANDATAPAPDTPYGRSKLEAERCLEDIAARTGLSAVTVRPPAVYGPGVTAFFRMLARAVRRGLPLPLAGVENRRSFIFVDNLADALLTAAEGFAPGAWAVTDSDPVSTLQLVHDLGTAFGREARVVPVPAGFLRAAASLVGKRHWADRMVESMALDGRGFRAAFGWEPRVGWSEALLRTAAALDAEESE